MFVAADVMSTTFHSLSPDMAIPDAALAFRKACDEENRRIFGMVVVGSDGAMQGMLSMYDLLLMIRPKHVHLWGVMDDIELRGLLDNVCQRTKSVLVRDIMSTDVITVSSETPVLLVLDLMIKKHVRRVPVVENGRMLGIVYISDLFYRIVDKLADQSGSNKICSG